MIENIKILLKNISYITAFIVTMLGLYTFFSQYYVEKYGVENENLQILNVKFVPSISFLDKDNGFYGNSDIRVTVKNVGNTKIQLTSDDVQIEGDDTLYSKCGGFGINRLQSDPKQSSVITINAGDEKSFTLSKDISFKKIIKYFDNDEFNQILVSKINKEYLLHDARIENKFLEYIKTQFPTASINIKLYTGYKKIIKTHTLHLYDAGTIFTTDGKIHYNSFLADIIANKQGKRIYGLQN
jgi:hypothetical protein